MYRFDLEDDLDAEAESLLNSPFLCLMDLDLLGEF